MQFSPITTAEWREKLQQDSKGSATYESLHWQTPEGIQLAPFYHYDSAPESPVIPFAKSENTWLINEIVRVETPAAANALALSALAGGAESLQFVIDSPTHARDDAPIIG